MMIVVSKMFLEEVHKACIARKNGVDKVDFEIQKQTLENLSDWRPDDCMIEMGEYDAFRKYEGLIPMIREIVKSKTAVCDECGYVYKKDEMIIKEKSICKECNHLHFIN